MIAPLLTFLSSSAGGALVGFVQTWMEQRREDRIRAEERQHQRELSHQQHSADMYAKSMEAARIKPIRYVYEKRKTRLKWFLFGPPIQCVKRVERDKLSQTPMERSSTVIVSILAVVYCLACLWVCLWISQDFKVVSPEAKQSGVNILGLFKIQWGGNKPVEQSGLSSLLYMLTPLVFIISNWIVRKQPRK